MAGVALLSRLGVFFSLLSVSLPLLEGKNTEKVPNIKIKHVLLSWRHGQTCTSLSSISNMIVNVFPLPN